MRKLLVIGIGVGDPDFLTIQAINAPNSVDVFFLLDKGPATADLTAARRWICERHIRDPRYRVVEVADPSRDRTASAYPAAVGDWRNERAHILEHTITTELGEDGCGGFLVWGGPGFYDGTIGVMETITARGAMAIDYEVIPGISSTQALAARHRIVLNRIGGSVHITTGRRLSEGPLPDATDIVVVLDAHLACTRFIDEDLTIFWGAYLGTPEEVLISGELRDVIVVIARTRRELRHRKGWIMDCYLLRRPTALEDGT